MTHINMTNCGREFYKQSGIKIWTRNGLHYCEGRTRFESGKIKLASDQLSTTVTIYKPITYTYIHTENQNYIRKLHNRNRPGFTYANKWKYTVPVDTFKINQNLLWSNQNNISRNYPESNFTHNYFLNGTKEIFIQRNTPKPFQQSTDAHWTAQKTTRSRDRLQTRSIIPIDAGTGP